MAERLTFGTLCSGIEAASAAWLPLGWECRYLAEIEPFPCAYLAQRHGAGRPVYMPRPEDADTETEAKRRRAAIKALDRIEWGSRLINFGDLSQVRPDELPAVDIIGAGFPCQDFSIAGLRQSLAGGRGSLSIIGVRLLLELAELGSVRGALLEQVPDVLNTEDNAWGNILGALVGADAALQGLEHGGKWPSAGMVAGPRARAAWRVLDAQHFGLAQRRERVWAVVDFGDGPDPAAVLFERQGVPGHPAARGEAGKDVAGTLAGGARGRGGYSEDDLPHVAHSLRAQSQPSHRADSDNYMPVAFGGNNTSGPIDIATARTASHTASGRQDFESETFIVGEPIAFNARQDPISGPISGPLDTDGGTNAIAFSCKDHGADAGDLSPTLRAMGHAGSHPNAGGQVAVAFSLRGREGGAMPEVEGGDVSPTLRSAEGGSTRPFVAFDETQITSKTNRSKPRPGQPCHPLTAQGRPPTLAWSIRPQNSGKDFKAREVDVAQSLMAAGPVGGDQGGDYIQSDMAVRRITVVEAERLQGFPDNSTLIDWPLAHRKDDDLTETVAYLRSHGFSDDEAAALAQTPDGPRYKAIGNSWPVTVARWLGERIQVSTPQQESSIDGWTG